MFELVIGLVKLVHTSTLYLHEGMSLNAGTWIIKPERPLECLHTDDVALDVTDFIQRGELS
jgi:hypothetical protein